MVVKLQLDLLNQALVPHPNPLNSTKTLRNQWCFLSNNDHYQDYSHMQLPLNQ